MRREEVLRTMEQAEELVRRAKEWLSEGEFIVGTKRSGALRRASLELTRALTEMRKP